MVSCLEDLICLDAPARGPSVGVDDDVDGWWWYGDDTIVTVIVTGTNSRLRGRVQD